MKDEDSIFGAKSERLNELVFQAMGDSRSDEQATETPAVSGFVEQLGSQIGLYKLVSVLGEGGMGIVYLADQKQPIRRRVALKIIKPGMDSKQVIARFEAERQALALLDHPNIAHVYGAGTTESGRPYFAMEYVKGVPITEHCDRCKLTITERLRLFLQVCEAVQHAHQKGIIHRDIKPSNIQIAIQDEQVTPKLIDFGVAKAIGQSLTDRTLVTEQGQFVGTPEYMSPEQAEMTGQDIDTRSDIYSLGVLLYELLTGILPFDPRTLREGGVDRIRHMIREEEPKTPSTRLSTVSGKESAKLARLRRTDIRTLGRRLHGDLDWITLKAMEKDRMRRYQTAHALAEDIGRHLNNEPVQAGPPSSLYRLQKFIRRHKTQAIGTAVAGVLLTVIVVVFLMYAQAVRQSKEAESFQHRTVLSKAMEYCSKGQFPEALSEVKTVVNSAHVGPEARLLRARIVLELRGPAEAIGQLEALTTERDEIASQAHLLLARVYLETRPDNPEAIGEFRRRGEEHQKKGEALFSETPEACFNRSIMAGTVDKSLAWLNRALELDPSHYDSLKARALAYYVLERFDEMEADASVMIGKASDNPQGYALRALARREKARLQDQKGLLFNLALNDHDKAIMLSPDEVELYDQRRQTCMQMGDHEQALRDAQRCVRLRPNKAIHHFNVFSAQVALGRFEQAQSKYDEILDSGLASTAQLAHWSWKYAFDVLAEGSSWHPPEQKPTGGAFLSMIRVEEDYRQLVAKGARRIVPKGFCPTWSPDGTQLVYSRGVVGSSGIEIVDLKTGRTRLLTVPGRDPVWSPDGEHIAFTRPRENLLLTDFATDKRRLQLPFTQAEIWLIRADGTEEPRFLTKGHWPWWSADGQYIYYELPEAKTFNRISATAGSTPETIMWSPIGWDAISPDDKCIAYRATNISLLRIVDLDTGTLTAAWNGLRGMIFINWSPDGRQLSMGNGHNSQEGLWLYDMETGQASEVLHGNITMGRWSPDGKRMVLALGPPLYELWVVDTNTLEPGRSLEEHFREDVRRHTLWIHAYPERALNYVYRAKSNVLLGEREKVLEDLRVHTESVRDRSDGGKAPEDLIAWSQWYNDPSDNHPLSVAAWAYHEVAWCLVGRPQEGLDLDVAIELYERAHEIQPEHWRYVCGLGAAYYHMGKWKRAITRFKESMTLTGGENAINYLFLAMANWQLGNKAAALELHDKAIESARDSQFGAVDSQSLYDIYLEAVELMGIKAREF